jgi:hypothetical protein
VHVFGNPAQSRIRERESQSLGFAPIPNVLIASRIIWCGGHFGNLAIPQNCCGTHSFATPDYSVRQIAWRIPAMLCGGEVCLYRCTLHVIPKNDVTIQSIPNDVAY